MKVFTIERRIIFAAAAVASCLLPLTSALAQGNTAHAGITKQASVTEQRLALARAGLKDRFGFTDAQVNTFIQRATAIGESYHPRILALQKKYGNSPKPDQLAKRNAELFTIVQEMGKRTNAALLAVATPAQRPHVEREVAFEAQALRMAQSRAHQMPPQKPAGKP